MNISLEVAEGIALLRMDDGKKNAVTADALSDLLSVIDIAEHEAEALVVAGRPGSFCAGFDRDTMMSGDAETISQLAQGGADISLRLAAFPKPVVAACTGHAFTIGTLWLLACDTRIGAKGAYKYGMTETALGKVLPPWSMELLRFRLAPHTLMNCVVQSQLLDDEGALIAGIVDELIESDKVVDAALTQAQILAQLPSEAYAGNKLALRKHLIDRMKADIEKGAPNG